MTLDKVISQFNQHMEQSGPYQAACVLSSKWRSSGKPTQKRIESYIQAHGLGHLFMYSNGCLVAA